MTIELAREMPIRSMSRSMSDATSKGFYSFADGETWSPAVNLYETEAGYVVCVDLAGVDKEKIEVVVEKHTLTVRGNRAVPTPAEPTAGQRRIRVHVMEIDHGMFCRQVELPVDVAEGCISAGYVDGMLWIELPKQ